VVGGAEDCNHSDHVTHDCKEINGKKTPCDNVSVGASGIQTCKDELVEQKDVCVQTNCENETMSKYIISSGCTKVNCTGS
jgi:hypothetical protein